MLKISRKDAKKAGFVRYYTGKPCHKGHLSQRLVSNGICARCNLEKRKIKKSENPNYRNKMKRNNYNNNKEKGRKRQRDYYEKNK